jgi:predicted kinase
VSSLLARDHGAPEALRARADREARRYFLLALSADRRPLLVPRVVAIGGVIAAGKSTIAELLGDRLSAPVIDSDRTRKAMLGVAPTEHVNDPSWRGAYDPRFTDRVYDEVLRRARVVLRSGRPVVLDASFRSPEMRRRARELAAEHAAPFTLVECVAPAELCRARLAERAKGAAVSDGRADIFDDFVARYQPPAELSPLEHLRLDTSRPLADTIAQLTAHIETWPKGLAA